MAESQVELDRALAHTRPDEHAAQIVHRILCIRCRMDWHCGGLSEDDFGEAGRIADLLAERDARVAAEAGERIAKAIEHARDWNGVCKAPENCTWCRAYEKAAAIARADREGDR